VLVCADNPRFHVATYKIDSERLQIEQFSLLVSNP
jgi:hypothetical protein